MSEFDCDIVASWISFEAHKPRDLNEAEWTTIDTLVKQIAEGESEKYENISVSECSFDLYRVTDVREYDILAESKNYYIMRDYEDASIYRKSDSSKIVCVGHHYGNPEDAYIDPEERYCITVGCGIIKYYLKEPYDIYVYDKATPQWIEVGRTDNIEFADKIEEVTDSYFVVSCEGAARRKFNLETLEKEELGNVKVDGL